MRNLFSKFLLIGGYGSNLGDDAMLISILMELTKKYPAGKIIVYCYNKKNIPDEAKRPFVNVIYVDKSDRVHIVSEVRVYGGGNQHFLIKNKDSIYDSVRRKVSHQVRNWNQTIFSLSKRFGKVTFETDKTIYLGIGLGPFDAVPQLSYLDNALVLFREKLSFNYYENAVLGCDPCFNPKFIESVTKSSSHSLKKQRVGIVVRDWYHDLKGNKVILNRIQQYINFLNSTHHVTIVNFCKVLDFDYKKKLKNYDSEIEYDSRKSCFYEFMESFYSFDLIITMRYHGLVFAAMMNKPAIGINIDPKIIQFTKEFNQSWITTVEVEDELKDFTKKVQNLNEIVVRIKSEDYQVNDYFDLRYKRMMEKFYSFLQ